METAKAVMAGEEEAVATTDEGKGGFFIFKICRFVPSLYIYIYGRKLKFTLTKVETDSRPKSESIDKNKCDKSKWISKL